MSIDRRRLLAGAVSTAFASIVASPAALASIRRQTLLISATAIPVREPAPPLDFDLFFDLSRYLTGRSVLDRDLGAELFAEFAREEWGWANAGRLYAIVRREIDAGTGSAPELLMSGRLAELDQWYARHVVETWYEGIYRYDGRERRITYERALMWEPVRDVMPVQGMSDADYGYWGVRPDGSDAE